MVECVIDRLCKAHTNLVDEDIDRLAAIACNLQYISDLVQADIFIDCLTRDPNVAIVVAEAKPSKSMYKYSVVGKLALRKNEPAALRTLEVGIPTRDLKAITQENMTVRQNVVPIKNSAGKTIAVLIMEMDITRDLNQHRQMQMLTETTEQLTETLISYQDQESKALAGYLNDAIIMFDRTGMATYANKLAEELYRKLGYKDNLLLMHFDNLVLDGSTLSQLVSGGTFKESEINAGNLSLMVKYAITNNQIVMLIQDVTDVKAKEKELILKAYAIREIHHRVKNNLQTVASLLGLQSRRVSDKNIKKMFDESINRILSIAVTHEILAQNGVDSVDIKTILSKIADNIHFGMEVEKLLAGDSILISSDIATSIALVVNELLQNSAEHAFIGREYGSVSIYIQKGLMYSSISVIDDGNGFNIDLPRRGSLGLSIVKSIVEDKLAGNLTVESSSLGTKVTFDFKSS